MNPIEFVFIALRDICHFYCKRFQCIGSRNAHTRHIEIEYLRMCAPVIVPQYFTVLTCRVVITTSVLSYRIKCKIGFIPHRKVYLDGKIGICFQIQLESAAQQVLYPHGILYC